MTKYAKSILNIVSEIGTHLTAEQIFFRMKEEYPGVVMATVYNNLNSLHDKGLIRKLSVEGFADRYDGIIPHDHVVCPKCGKFTDVQIGNLTGELRERSGMDFDYYDLKLFKFCEDCAG